MTKMIKMSLIAAVAVTGMTSTVCAQPLEDAIKGVDVSGMLRYRYDDTHVKNATSSTQANEYTMKIATKAKVNDMVTANVQVEALGVNTNAATGTGTTANNYESAHATNDTTGDRDVTLAVTKANFAANLGFATVVAGKQSVPSPFVDNWNDDLTRGTGAVALIPVAGQTIAAGHFMNFQTAEGDVGADSKNYGTSIDALAVIGSVAGINYDAWYVKANGTAANTATTALSDTTAKSLGLNTTIAGITFDGRISTVARDALGSTLASDSKLSKLVASTKVGPVTVTAGAAFTPKNNVDTTLDGDNDSKSGFRLWQASTEKLNDSSAYLVGAKMEVMPGLTLSADYVTADATAAAVVSTTLTAAQKAAQDVTITEALYGATYAMSKNFSVHARYSMMKANYDVRDDVETNKGRLEIKYTF